MKIMRGGAGNVNGTPISLAGLQFLNFTPVEVINPSFISDYQAAIQSTLVFSNPPTTTEIRNVILDVNRTNVFEEVLEDSASNGGASNANGASVTLADLQSVGLLTLNPVLIADYQAAINTETTFGNPTTFAQVQAIIDTINTEEAETRIYTKILEDSASTGGANNADGNAVTLTLLQAINIINMDATIISNYQAAIQAETGFSNPPTKAEVQAVIDAANQAHFTSIVLTEVGEDAAGNANGVLVTANQLAFVALTEYYKPFIIEYQAGITGGTYTFSTPVTLAEVQAIVTGVNAAQQAIIPYVYNSTTEEVWMDRNVGATSNDPTDTASYGDYY